MKELIVVIIVGISIVAWWMILKALGKSNEDEERYRNKQNKK